MIENNANCAFKAQWNASLHPDYGDPLWVKVRKIRDFLFTYPNKLFAFIFNPASPDPHYPYFQERADCFLFTKQIITSDEVSLSARVCLLKKKAPVAILFNPLGASRDIYADFVKVLLSKGISTVQFNYRSYKETNRALDLVVDGDAVYQYVVKELSSDSKVFFYGHSLGGAIAAKTKAVNGTSGKYAGDRTFQSVFKIITDFLSIQKLGKLIEKVTVVIAAILIAYPFTALGWEWDVKGALESMKGDNIILYHPEDNFFSFSSSLASCRPKSEIVKLTNSSSSPHTIPIDECKAEDTSAAVLVANFFSS